MGFATYGGGGVSEAPRIGREKRLSERPKQKEKEMSIDDYGFLHLPHFFLDWSSKESGVETKILCFL